VDRGAVSVEGVHLVRSSVVPNDHPFSSHVVLAPPPWYAGPPLYFYKGGQHGATVFGLSHIDMGTAATQDSDANSDCSHGNKAV
jgi:hypothetical protein